ncbi:CRAL-TRIO domain-containing protein [Chytridium lagenaria]|nr:CRAL-TRIO domain-containing protein [Chytridium lagenaria]
MMKRWHSKKEDKQEKENDTHHHHHSHDHSSHHKQPTDEDYKQIGTTLDWRESYKWTTLLDEDFSQEMAVGKLCIKGVDVDGYPVAIWKQARHRPDDFGVERDIRFIIYSVEKAKQSGIIKDRISLIIDRIGMNNTNFDSPLMKTLLSTFQTYFPEHLARLFVFPKNMLLSVGFNVAKVFLDAETVERVKILTEDEHKPCLQQYITHENLFKRFGGTQEDPHDEEDTTPRSSTSSQTLAASPVASVQQRKSSRGLLGKEGTRPVLSPRKSSAIKVEGGKGKESNDTLAAEEGKVGVEDDLSVGDSAVSVR